MRNFKKEGLILFLHIIYMEMMPAREVTEEKIEMLVAKLRYSSKKQLIDLWNQVIDCGIKWDFDNGDWTVIKNPEA